MERKVTMTSTQSICTIRTINSQLLPYRRNQLRYSTNKDPVISELVKRYVREGWPQHIDRPEVQEFKQYSSSRSMVADCLINGNRTVIPEVMRQQILDILHLGHFDMQQMKHMARSAVYWPHIDSQIEDICKCCSACAEHLNKPPQPANHLWIIPEKAWSRIHFDYAINFMESYWLIVPDTYFNYSSDQLHIYHGNHYAFRRRLCSLWIFSSTHHRIRQRYHLQLCRVPGIVSLYRDFKHLTVAPYHPATNGAAERLVQSLTKSKLPPRPALKEFVMQYRRTPFNTGFLPSQLLNDRQIRTKIDSLLPSPAHIAQERQATDARKSQQKELSTVQHVRTRYTVGTACYALYCDPRHTNSPRWVPANVTKVYGTRSFTVKAHLRGPLWKRHWEQLRPRYTASMKMPTLVSTMEIDLRLLLDNSTPVPQKNGSTTQYPSDETNPHTVPEYRRHNPQRPGRHRKPRPPCKMNC